MIRRFKAWRERRVLARRPITEPDWRHALAHCAPARRLAASDQARLRVLATLFLDSKSIEPVQGLSLDDSERTLLAAHACLPILKLDLDWYRGWHSVVVYPNLFVPHHQRVDHAGVVHHERHPLSGEAWSQGPVVLSWQAVLESGATPGENVTVHEMAHKLDMLNGAVNGYPPLHAGMDRSAWSVVLTTAWERMQAAYDTGEELPMNPYALENPGEFFAVASEVFFEESAALKQHLPDIYRQLALFYRQQP